MSNYPAGAEYDFGKTMESSRFTTRKEGAKYNQRSKET